jgi:hypothetical protein
MPHRSRKFTDSNLKLLYGNLLSHYKECTKKLGVSDVHSIYRELFLATQYAVESPQGSLYHLERREKEKVYTALHTIFYALPLFNRLPPDKQRCFNPARPRYNPLINPQYIYNCSDPKSFDWVTLNQNLNPFIPYLKQNSNQDEPVINVSKINGKVIGLIVVSLVFSVAILTLLAWYYLFHQLINSAERMWYNEGWLRAVLMSAAAITFSSVTTNLTLIFASSPILTIAFAAGINPISALIVSSVILASIGASLGAFLVNSLYDYMEKRAHPKSMEPSDPYRFMISEDEEDELIAKQIDPIKVKCALVALRLEINLVLNKAGHTPSFLSRHLGSQKSKQVQPLLQMVRGLRRGEVTEAQFGDLKFDCRLYNSPDTCLPQWELYPPILAHQDLMTAGEYTPPTPPVLSSVTLH